MKLRNIITSTSLVLLGSGAVSASTYLYVCQSCPAGTYGDGTEESCIPCGKGTYSAGNTGSCTPCAKGTSTNDKTGQASCSLCTGRTYTDKTGQATCSSCSDGTRVNADHTGCVTCSAGTYSNNGTTCEPCKGESYSNWSSEECGTRTRTKTTYCNSTGNTSSTANPKQETETSTRNCQSGYECISNRCYIICPANSTRSGTSCVCNSGYTMVSGSCVLNNCSAGQYRSGTSCVTCEVGYYCPGDNLRYTCSTCYYELRTWSGGHDDNDNYRDYDVTLYCQKEGSTSAKSNSYDCTYRLKNGKLNFGAGPKNKDCKEKNSGCISKSVRSF